MSLIGYKKIKNKIRKDQAEKLEWKETNKNSVKHLLAATSLKYKEEHNSENLLTLACNNTIVFIKGLW